MKITIETTENKPFEHGQLFKGQHTGRIYMLCKYNNRDMLVNLSTASVNNVPEDLANYLPINSKEMIIR